VEYKKDQKSGLALITQRDGKRNWNAIDTRLVQLSFTTPPPPYHAPHHPARWQGQSECRRHQVISVVIPHPLHHPVGCQTQLECQRQQFIFRIYS